MRKSLSLRGDRRRCRKYYREGFVLVVFQGFSFSGGFLVIYGVLEVILV